MNRIEMQKRGLEASRCVLQVLCAEKGARYA